MSSFKLADAERVATLSGRSIPSRTARESLRPGDEVVLLSVHEEDSGLGDGILSLAAVVRGRAGRGEYLGELEDGREIVFKDRHVAASGPSMGGIFDWFKSRSEKKKAESTLPALRPERGTLIPQEGPKFFSRIREWASGLVPGGGASREKPVFAPFIPEEAPSPGRAIMLPPLKEVAEFREEERTVAFIPEEGPKILTRLREEAAAIAVPEGPGPLAPIAERAREIVEFIQPSTEIEPFETRQARQVELWEGLFPKPEEGARPLSEMFKAAPFTKEETEPQKEMHLPEMPSRVARRLKILPLPRRREILPGPEDLARAFVTSWEMDDVWEAIRNLRKSPEWLLQLKENEVAIEPFETLGICGGRPTLFEELASYFHIPWEELRARVRTENITDPRTGEAYEEWVDVDRVWEDVIFPLRQILTRAFDLIKPRDIPGHFVLEQTHDHPELPGGGCQLAIAYMETAEEGVPDIELLVAEYREASSRSRESGREFIQMLERTYGAGFAKQIEELKETFARSAEAEKQLYESYEEAFGKKSEKSREGWKQTSLGELLPMQAVAPVNEVINAALRGEIQGIDVTVALKEVLEPFREALKRKDVEVNFLAAYLDYAVKSGMFNR